MYPSVLIFTFCLGLNSGKVGARFRLNEATEEYLAGLLKDLGKWRIPFSSDDVRRPVKGYLDKKGITDKVRTYIYIIVKNFILVRFSNKLS